MAKLNQDQVSGIVRHVITSIGAVLVATGKTDDATVQMAAGAIVTVIGLAWSIFSKVKN